MGEQYELDRHLRIEMGDTYSLKKEKNKKGEWVLNLFRTYKLTTYQVHDPVGLSSRVG